MKKFNCDHQWSCLTLAAAFLVCASAAATDVGFWAEYKPDQSDVPNTYLLVQFNEQSWADAVPGERRELRGKARLVEQGRFGGALQVDGQSSAVVSVTNVFEGGRVSLEAWVRLEKYPETEGYIIFRPAKVDQHASYSPEQDRSKGFALLVDASGAVHLETVNTFYGKKTRTSSAAGAVPVGRWVHLAGISSGAKRLFVDGTQVAEKSINWGEGLQVQGEPEIEAQPIYIGNNDQGTHGVSGLIDQVRVHRNIQKFWAPEAEDWTRVAGSVSHEPPYFVKEHAPVAVARLDGDSAATGSSGATVELGGSDFRPGVRGKAFAGKVTLSAPNLFQAGEGSLEFWLKPLGINNLSDKNRTFLGEPFIFYLFNGGEQQPTVYFNVKEGGLHFVHAPAEIHPARWYHWVFTWRNQDIRIYLDGKLAGRTTSQKLAPGGRTVGNRFVFNPNENIGLLDEICVYDRALLPEEAANAFWRYRDASKLTAGVRLPSVEMQAEYFPSQQKLVYNLVPFTPPAEFKSVQLGLHDAQGALLQQWESPWAEASSGELKLPTLPAGECAIRPVVTMANGQSVPGQEFKLYARRFAWEGNTLGMTEEVFAPFTPVQVQGNKVAVVSRSMTMNGFGLWDEVVSLGRNILAAPMRIRFETASGEGRWSANSARLVTERPTAAVFEATAESDAVRFTARSTIEIDGCMKVQMQMLPGTRPAELKRLWLEIPIKDSEAQLMHTLGDGLRHNYAGAVPAGEGRVWDGSKVARTEPWRNAFVPYTWIGSAERGLAFFAENDNGWVTEKGKSKAPTHELIRENGRLFLRVYLVNKPVTISTARSLVFGLQASPTKPMPPNWRRDLPHMPGGLAVVPWGGIQCASQGPFADDWTIVDKILEAREGKKFDSEWLANYARQHNPPKTHNESDWTYYMNHFAQRAKDVGPTRPIAVYQEEMRAAHSRPEWLVYQDEWKTSDGPAARTSPEGLDLRGGHRSFSGISEITFSRSYADFGAWMANEWLKRGVSLYWDNTYLYPSHNTRTTAAYLTEDGQIQPALTIWAVREYHKRVWHLLQQRRRERKEPLEWTLHMTNTELLPVHTWGTVQLDHELAVKKPFSPEWLMTETIGRQVGNCPLSLYEVSGRDNPVLKKLPKAQADRIEWGLRAVHEIQRSGPMEKLLREFGYGTDQVAVNNYWADEPVVSVTPKSVKWLALSKPGEVLLVLASWSEEPVQAQVTALSTGVKGVPRCGRRNRERS